jgi:L-seryl-tRNA(Ser) seleniumtransferase
VIAAARPGLGEREHDAVVAVARQVVAAERARIAAAGSDADAVPVALLAGDLVARLEAFDRTTGPAPVINASGVIVHTNLGRAPWPAAASEAARAAVSGALFLELDRASGRRGRRYREAEDHLIALTGAEDALVTNNNAAALALAVGLAGRRGVAVSRGELVEIGGGVRIPEIVRRAGARLVEVGTTNRTRVADFEAPLAEGRATVVLRVHPSNFVQAGFVEAPDPVALADLAHAHGAIVVDDLGSGALVDTAEFGLAHEPTPSERLAAGADLVLFSGDKLVGGPQAGLVVGRADLVARLRKDPLARATRPDKATLAGVAATLALYRAGVARREIPVWRAIAADLADLRRRAEALAGTTATGAAATATTATATATTATATGAPEPGPSPAGVEVVELESTVGGGALPGATLASFGLALPGPAEAILARLRRGDPAVVGRIERGRVLLDLRTVEPARDADLRRAILAAVQPAPARR